MIPRKGVSTHSGGTQPGKGDRTFWIQGKTWGCGAEVTGLRASPGSVTNGSIGSRSDGHLTLTSDPWRVPSCNDVSSCTSLHDDWCGAERRMRSLGNKALT